jgi:hypothetical protein
MPRDLIHHVHMREPGVQERAMVIAHGTSHPPTTPGVSP